MKRNYTSFCLGMILLFGDFVSKYYTEKFLPLMQYYWSYPYGGIGIFKNFLGIELSLAHQDNLGAAWGLFAEYQIPLLYLRIFLIIGLFIYLACINQQKSQTIPLTLIFIGALGNVIDFFFYGHVVDMIHFVFWGYNYPVFNLADTFIFIGIAWILLLSFLEHPKTSTEH